MIDDSLRPNGAGAAPQVHAAFVELAEVFSSIKIMGPPMSDKLLKLVSHLYSVEEAEVCKGLTFLSLRSAAAVARICKRKTEEVSPILASMAQRRVIHESQSKFMLYPLIPGLFEYVFMTGQDSPWHAEYAKLLNDLFGTGYIREYLTREIGAVRNVPVQRVIENTNYVVNAGLMSSMLDAHERFAVLNYCPCRHSKKILGRSCKRAKPEDGCLVFGEFSAATVASGNGRAVTRAEMRDVVADRWEKKLVFLTANVNPAAQNVICTCCDCCCHAVETANHYSKNFIAPARCVVEVDESLCSGCGRCVDVCNMGAHAVTDRKHTLNAERCIGCGHCVEACKKNAVRMIENPSFKKPSNGYAGLLLRMMPSIAMMGLKIKWSRYRNKTS